MDGRETSINTELEDTINMFYRRNKQLFYTIPWNIFQERFLRIVKLDHKYIETM